MPSLKEALHTFLLEPRAPDTQRQYAHVLERLIAEIGPARSVSRVAYEDLLEVHARYRQTLKPITVNGYLNIWKAFFAWCQKRQYVKRSPAADLVRIKVAKIPADEKAVPQNDLLKLLEYLRVTSARNFAMVMFLADTGCRVGGLLSMRWSRIGDGTAHLVEKGSELVQVKFGEHTAAALLAWRERQAIQTDVVWTGKGTGAKGISRQGVEALFRSWSEHLHLSRRCTPHDIRHGVGHAWAKAGMPHLATQAKLNHKSVRTTLENYYPDRMELPDFVAQRLELVVLNDPALVRAQIAQDTELRKRRA